MHIYDTDRTPIELLPHVDAAIAVFSTASKESFQRLQVFSDPFALFQKQGGLLCLVGTHTDLDPQQVSPEQDSEMAYEIKAELFRVCVRNSDEAWRPWDFILRQYIHRVNEEVVRPIERLAPPTAKNGFLKEAWHHCLRSTGHCYGLRKTKSKIWYS